jgi:hypothetical protein
VVDRSRKVDSQLAPHRDKLSKTGQNYGLTPFRVGS